jgi:hypothetical protein
MDTSSAYNKFTDYPLLSYNITSYLMDNNELIWKLLYYDTPDAWDKGNLTSAQKAALIYKGEEDGTPFKVFFDPGNPDVETKQTSVLKISPIGAVAKNRTVGIITMCMEVYVHYKINTLSNYTTRMDTIIQQIVETLNGVDVGGVGKLFFDGLRDQTDRIYDSGKTPFKGKKVYMSTNEA